jgi:hypothetical protein
MSLVSLFYTPVISFTGGKMVLVACKSNGKDREFEWVFFSNNL